MMGTIPAVLVFVAGALTFCSGYLLGSRTSFIGGHYRGVQDALDIVDDRRDDL